VSASDQARATLLDVARLAGVSRSTASLAFSGAGPVSEATRAKVMAASASLGYSGPDPRARSLRQGRSGVVGIVFDETLLSAFRDPVNVATLDGIASGLGDGSNGLLLLTETGAVESSIASAAIDAAVLMGCSPVFDRVVVELERRGVPVVSIEGGAGAASASGADPAPAAPAGPARVDVALDNVEASETLARHLHELGHRRVGVLSLATDPSRETGLITPEREAALTTTVTADRLAGVRRVFPDAVAVSSGWNSVDEAVRAARMLLGAAGDDGSGAQGGGAQGGGAQGGRSSRAGGGGLGGGDGLGVGERGGLGDGWGLGRVRPTAVLAQSDLLAVGVLQAAAELGLRVPEDLSLTGFDGVPIGGLAGHDLTTMVQPAAEKGREAGRAVRALLAGEEVGSVVFRCTFHRGATTAPPRA
jgi:DNA-binding LacI/PurR family transcriptional regulator